jgi:hypothetical protein
MTEYLSSWNDGVGQAGDARVRPAGDRGAPRFVLPPDRAAALDHDGALRCENPAFPQVDFLAVRWAVSMRDDFKVVFDQ